MDQKTKFIIIGCAGVLVISLAINIFTQSGKQRAEQERDTLRAEKQSLTRKIETVLQEKKQVETKLEELNNSVAKLTKDKTELQQKADVLTKERNDLAAKVQAQVQSQPQVQAQPAVTKPETQPELSPAQDAYWAGVLKEKEELGTQLENLRNQMKTLQLDYEQAKKDKEAADLELKNASREKEELSQQMNYNAGTLTGVASELVREKNAHFTVEDRVKSMKDENASLRHQLKSLNNYKLNLERKLVKLQQEKTDIERRYDNLNVFMEDKMAKLAELKSQWTSEKSNVDTVETADDKIDSTPAAPPAAAPESARDVIELPPIVVKSGQPSEESSGDSAVVDFSAKVISINPQDNFVIINRGTDAGVKVGDVLPVYRKNTPIAKIKVIQARQNIAACDIREQATAIKVGDTIK